MSRESDIQELCKQVLDNCYPNYNDNNGVYSCPFCGGEKWGEDADEMKNIIHEQDCAYLIAKDLSTHY
jgi:hypothetical protein